jgi:hypothetical protein
MAQIPVSNRIQKINKEIDGTIGPFTAHGWDKSVEIQTPPNKTA